MGSASRDALRQARTALTGALGENAGVELLRVAGELTLNPNVAAAFGDSSAAVESKDQLVSSLFGSLSAGARNVLIAAVSGRWSSTDELISGIEELGLRAEAISNAALVDELLAVAEVVDSSDELELTLGSKLLPGEGKISLLQRLLGGKVSNSTIAVVTQLVVHPRGHRLNTALSRAARIAADQGGYELVTVTVARPLNAQQHERLSRQLEQTAGRAVKITTVIDPALIGGVRIEIADDVIDGSIRARLHDLRQQLAA